MISRSRLIHLAGSALAIIALVYFVRTLAQYWAQLSGAISSPRVALAAVCAVVVGIAGYFSSAIAWVQICRALGLDIGHVTAFRVYFISQFGKYLPGNVAHHVGRLAMCIHEKLPGTAVATSQLVEIVMIISVLSIIALTVGSSYLRQWDPGVARIKPSHIALAAVVIVSVSLVAIRLVRHWSPLSHISDLIYRLIASQQGIAHLASAAILIFANAAMATLGLYLIGTAISGVHFLSFTAVGCIFIVSWLAGFMTPGTPAGLGVRETVMLTLLSQTMPVSDAVATSLVFRIATTGTDLSVVGLGFGLRTYPRRKNVAAH